jgi:hypothetical protein
MLFAVDKAWLLLQPYELPDVDDLFADDYATEPRSATSSSSPLNPAALALWKQVSPYSDIFLTLCDALD